MRERNQKPISTRFLQTSRRFHRLFAGNVVGGIVLSGVFGIWLLLQPGAMQAEAVQLDPSYLLETQEAADTEKDVEITTEEETTEQSQTEPAAEGEAQTEAVADPWVEEQLARLTMEEKVAQLFVIAPESLTGMGQVTAAGETTRQAYDQIPVGGLVYFESNLQSGEQIREMLSNSQKIAMERVGLPLFLCTDEEGGTVRRISGRGILDVPYIDAAYTIGQSGADTVFVTGTTMGTYLADLGFTVDFAPVADVLSNPANTVIGQRAFSENPETAAQMVEAFVQGMNVTGTAATLKHFPGHGDTAEDSHSGTAVSYKTLEELRTCEFLPFRSGIAAGAEFVMVGHISLPNVTGDMTPATVSKEIVTGLLREELGFEGIIITDAMAMGAIANVYTSADAAVKSLEAGVDVILMPYDFPSAYQGVLSAVQSGQLPEERIDESLRRILAVKEKIIRSM